MVVEAKRLVCTNRECKAEIIVVKKPASEKKEPRLHLWYGGIPKAISPTMRFSTNTETVMSCVAYAYMYVNR